MIDLTGRTFGYLTVIKYAGSERWTIKCSCKKEYEVNGRSLRSGRTKSCGCQTKRLQSLAMTTHGQTVGGKFSKVYGAWSGMLSRCSKNKKNREYKRYGARGITVCRRWQKFENFYTDMGDSPPGTQLDRIDNNAGYSLKNCRWTTPLINTNNREITKRYPYAGGRMTITEISKITGVPRGTLNRRLWSGVPLDEAADPKRLTPLKGGRHPFSTPQKDASK